jgi:small subunit ribosomal protein S17
MAATQKTRVGRVVSAKMQKTVVVAVDQRRVHRIYHKPMQQVARFKAHDENGVCNEGDLVRIQETRPLSKEKRWRVVEVIEKGTVALLPNDEEAATQR